MSAKGFGAAAVAVLCFGSNFVPVKQYETGDGMFFQWVMCASIFLVGVLVQLIRNTYLFEPFAVLGGVLWCTGNLCTVPTIRCIGMGLGLLMWGTSSLVIGWATGAFGLFGLDKNDVNKPGLNYAGFTIAILSMGIFFFVKNDDKAGASDKANAAAVFDSVSDGVIDDSNKAHTQKSKDDLDVQLEADAAMLANDLSQPLHGGAANSNGGTSATGKSAFDKLSPLQKRLLGFTLAIGSGIFYGCNFDPPQYLIDTTNRGVMVFGRFHSTDSLDYVFSHFTGIFFASTVYFLIYCAAMNNRPAINTQLVLPSFVSGSLWAVAQCMWFIANSELQFVVSFPIICTGPGVVAALWGVFKFKEVSGTRNLSILVLACSVTIIGVICIALSRIL